MTLQEIHKEYDKLQIKYGEPNLKAVYGGGYENEPNVLFIFMNPTATNLASKEEWKGINAPFLGTKNVFKLLFNLNLLDEHIYTSILNKKNKDWTEDFAKKVYDNIKSSKIYITNLAKCTQIDAKSLKDEIFNKYLSLLEEEIEVVSPKKIICFGNQVSSIFLGKEIKVSEVRSKEFVKTIKDKIFKTYCIYYPIGLGFRNIDKVMEDLKKII